MPNSVRVLLYYLIQWKAQIELNIIFSTIFNKNISAISGTFDDIDTSGNIALLGRNEVCRSKLKKLLAVHDDVIIWQVNQFYRKLHCKLQKWFTKMCWIKHWLSAKRNQTKIQKVQCRFVKFHLLIWLDLWRTSNLQFKPKALTRIWRSSSRNLRSQIVGINKILVY